MNALAFVSCKMHNWIWKLFCFKLFFLFYHVFGWHMCVGIFICLLFDQFSCYSFTILTVMFYDHHSLFFFPSTHGRGTHCCTAQWGEDGWVVTLLIKCHKSTVCTLHMFNSSPSLFPLQKADDLPLAYLSQSRMGNRMVRQR